ncbi:MAG TPA: tRNA pseudouridine(13) synthase TruD, partial [Halomonas sp.]|nr:tRNA pseudouridine(13) synthase TruD [Halomonas sp.]
VLWGVGDSVAGGEARAVEATLPARYPGLCRGLEQAGVRLARRSLRLALADPTLERHTGPAGGEALLMFSLPRGAFATAVLRELITHPGL